jgi:hypothetical protein
VAGEEGGRLELVGIGLEWVRIGLEWVIIDSFSSLVGIGLGWGWGCCSGLPPGWLLQPPGS